MGVLVAVAELVVAWLDALSVVELEIGVAVETVVSMSRVGGDDAMALDVWRGSRRPVGDAIRHWTTSDQMAIHWMSMPGADAVADERSRDMAFVLGLQAHI